MPQYRLEQAKTGRATCVATGCKDDGVKILKDELRFGVFVTIKDHQTWKWKHWGCVTPRQIESIKDTIENNLDYFDGFDEISEAKQAKVRQALTDGHVADEDWKWDVEVNRPGMDGYLNAEHKKERRLAKVEDKRLKKELEEGGASIDEEAATKKPASNKRRKTEKDAEHADDEPEAPAQKRTKVKKEANGVGVKSEDESLEKVKAEPFEDLDLLSSVPEKPRPTKKAKSVKSAKVEADAEDVKAAKGRKPKAKAIKSEDGFEVDVNAAAKKVNGTTKAKAGSKKQAEAQDVPVAPTKKQRGKKSNVSDKPAPKKAEAAKKMAGPSVSRRVPSRKAAPPPPPASVGTRRSARNKG